MNRLMPGVFFLPGNVCPEARARRWGEAVLFVVLLLLGASGCADGPTSEDPPSEEQSLPPGLDVIRLGADTDVTPTLTGPSLLLQGSGRPLDTAYRAHIGPLTDRPLDVVVLAASFPDGESLTPECDVVAALQRVNSCTTLTITAPEAAGADTAATLVRQAEAVYFAGGNQCNYVKWKRRAVHEAVTEVFERGGGVGGGSAGLAIQGEVVYDGCTGSVRSHEALTDPYHSRISFTDGYFEWGFLDRLITDSHFQERDRMGRLTTFVARQIEGAERKTFDGLGVNEGAAVVVDSTGTGTVYGGRVYLVHGGHRPETMDPDTPLTYADVQIVRLSAGATYDLTERPLDAAYERSVEAGSLSASPYDRR